MYRRGFFLIPKTLGNRRLSQSLSLKESDFGLVLINITGKEIESMVVASKLFALRASLRNFSTSVIRAAGKPAGGDAVHGGAEHHGKLVHVSNRAISAEL